MPSDLKEFEKTSGGTSWRMTMQRSKMISTYTPNLSANHNEMVQKLEEHMLIIN